MGTPLDIGAIGGGVIGSAAQGIVSAGMGMALGAYNDKRQLKQQRRLLEQQQGFDQTQGKFNSQMQLEMWEKTNYSAQKEQMKKAGLNPALMYGMSGGGGTTTGQPQGQVHSAPAPSGGREIMDMMQMQAQQAQIALMQAQAEKAKVEAEKAAGVDSANVEAATALQNAQRGKVKIEGDLLEIERKIRNETAEESIITIENAMQIQSQQLQAAVRSNGINDATYNEQIKQIQENLTQTGLENILLKTNNALGRSKITQISAQIAQGWAKLSQGDQQLVINTLTMGQGAERNTIEQRNSDTNHGRLELEKQLKNLTDNDKELYNLLGRLLQALSLGTLIKK